MDHVVWVRIESIGDRDGTQFDRAAIDRGRVEFTPGRQTERPGDPGPHLKAGPRSTDQCVSHLGGDIPLADAELQTITSCDRTSKASVLPRIFQWFNAGVERAAQPAHRIDVPGGNLPTFKQFLIDEHVLDPTEDDGMPIELKRFTDATF